MGVLSPIYGFALLLLLPIVALYLLRPKSENKIIASTFLWEQTLHALNSERLDKKLIRNWLFYLQIATIILGAFLLMQPYFAQNSIKSDEAVIIIDASLSMQTEFEGQSRFENAKRGAVEFVKALEGEPNMSLYVLGDSLDLLYRGNVKNVAIRHLESLVPTYEEVDEHQLEDLLATYEGVESEHGIYVFTDHIMMTHEKIQYALSRSGSNTVGILSVTTRQSEDDILCRVKVKNYASNALDGSILVYGDGQLIKMVDVNLGPLSDGNLEMAFLETYQVLEFKWGEDDDYLLDNTYFLALSSNETKKILLTGVSNRYLEEVFMIFPNVEVYRADDVNIKGDYDLYVYNGALPEVLPDFGGIMMINPKEDRSYIKLGKVYTKGQLTFDMKDPLWRHVNPNFNMKAVRTIQSPLGESMMAIDGEPVMVKTHIDEHQTLIMGLDFMDTDFPIRVGFPVFMYNSVTYLIGDLSRGNVQGLVGNALSVYGDPSATQRSLVDASGQRTALSEEYLLKLQAEEPGFYCLEESNGSGETNKKWLAFNVSRDEEIDFEYEGHDELNVLTRDTLGYRSFKWPLAICLIVILLIEWWVYYREN